MSVAFCRLPAQASSTGSEAWRRLVEADWLDYEESLVATNQPHLLPSDDAAGGCDGVKDGGPGFHTEKQDQPWWQVDLGKPQPVARVVIWNRCDCSDRAARLLVKVSDDARTWTTVYQHDGRTFYGFSDSKPLTVLLTNQPARFVRIQLPGNDYLHLDEVEVFGPADVAKNLALHQPANQSSLSIWSKAHSQEAVADIDWARRTQAVLAFCDRLFAELPEQGSALGSADRSVLKQHLAALRAVPSSRYGQAQYLEARWLQRRLALANPLLDFEAILVTKRVPGSFNHMSDQYYGWWSRPGGGIFVLKNFRSDAPQTVCLTPGMETGSFGRIDLSWDAKRVLFAWCRYYPNTSANPNKTDKASLPEDGFYHVFEMNVDGSGLRQITHGRYDDFEPTYLPDGEICFLSTRRGQAAQYTKAAAQMTLTASLPDGYVRCGGDNFRPVPIYTLHEMKPDGSDLHPLSPFENFEWSPSVSRDGRILFARWDYVDRSNMPYMKLWSTYPDGTDPRMVYGNFTTNPFACFEARSIPGSEKIVFTACAHHSITGGSLVLLDPNRDVDGQAALKRLTPEVCFPESEGWPISFYANPYPLSENFYLCGWSNRALSTEGSANSLNGLGVYLLDAFGDCELLCRDAQLSCMYPTPLRARPIPPSHASNVAWDGPQVGQFLLLNVYDGLAGVARGAIKRLRIVGVPPKTQPVMNSPNLGVTSDDPGKFVVGSVPVEADGSAYFQAPSGVSLFFQALDADGLAVQTMRTVTYLQPGQTLSCVGCHENRMAAPTSAMPAAATHAASLVTPGPEGSWPMRYDKLVQPVLDANCASCHNPKGHAKAAAIDLSSDASYAIFLGYGSPSLADHVRARYGEGRSVVGKGAAATNPLLAMLKAGHHHVSLSSSDLDRLTTWMDIYGQRQGSFSPEQEKSLAALRAGFLGTLLQPVGEGQ